MKAPELMMPAGSYDTLKASIVNGADAVYFGSGKFNARLNSKNFATHEELKQAIDFPHFFGKKAYLAINTLVKDNEMVEALSLAKEAYELGVDAIIVQDLGFMFAVKTLLPNLELHASTQCTCHSVKGAELLADLGVKRIVLARELSLKEVNAIKIAMDKRDVEIETFVHGALCFSYSGQCLFSSFAFNKSGNRGQCLQPCRMIYSLEEEKTKQKKKGYLLSMKDQEMVGKMSPLVEAGIDSLKIEGRLKGVGYCAAVAKAYRLAIDAAIGKGKGPSAEDIKLMKIAFLRDHNAGYMFEEPDMVSTDGPARKGILAAEVISFRDKMPLVKLEEDLSAGEKLSGIKDDDVWEFLVIKMMKGQKDIFHAYKGEIVSLYLTARPFLDLHQKLYFTSSKRLDNFAYSSIKGAKRKKYSVNVSAIEGQELSAEVTIEGKKISVLSGFKAEQSKTASTSEGMLKEKLFKESEFLEPEEFACVIKGNPFLPLSILKKFKNTILSTAEDSFFEKYRRDAGKDFEERKNRLINHVLLPPSPTSSNEINFAFFTDKDPAKLLVRDFTKKPVTSIVLYESMGVKGVEEATKNFPTKKILIKSSNIQHDLELEKFDQHFVSKQIPVVVSNLGALKLAILSKSEFWVDRELNIFNSFSIKLMEKLGAKKIIPSVELSLEELKKLSLRELLIPLIYFYPLLMTSRAYVKNNPFNKGLHELEDRKGFKYHTTIDEHGLLRVYNPVPVDMAFEMEKFSDFLMLGVDVCSSNEAESITTIEFASNKLGGKGASKSSKFTRGHFDKPIE
ncbi:MAG: U32 family peptidase [archaeon]